MTKAKGKAYDPKTNAWTAPVEYEAKDHMDAVRWCRFNKDWFKDLIIIEISNVEMRHSTFHG